MDWEYLAQAWREIPRDWKISMLCIFVGGLYLLLEIWSIVSG